MDTLRKTLWLSLAIISVWLWHTWQEDFAIRLADPQPTNTTPSVLHTRSSESVQTTTLESSLPFIPKENQITFQTDVIRGIIDKEGGHLIYLALLKYPASIDAKDPFVLLDYTDNRYYTAQTDLLTPGESKRPKKEPWYQSKYHDYSLSSEQAAIAIDLHREENGVKITKQFLLKKGEYQIDVSYQLNNTGHLTYKAQPYAQLVQQKTTRGKHWLSNTAYSGGVISSDIKPYEKVAFNSMGKKSLAKSTKQAWLSFVEPYFISAWISRVPNITYYSHQHHNIYTLGMLGNQWTVEPGNSLTGDLSLYVGPKIAETLKASAPHLDLLIDYGMFWFIASNLFWLLKQCYYWLRNWGWAIVCATVLLKLSLYRLSAKQFRTTLVMRQLQTKLETLKAHYAHDQQALNQATIDLYRREGVNPIKGSLIAFIQLPISLALNAVLLESVELRHEPFIFWIRDLAATDPYYILPALLGLTMFTELFIDQTLTAQAGSRPSQSNAMLLFMPLVFTLVATNFPTGLALYWFVQNIFSSIQKWWLLGRPLPNIRHVFSKN